MNIELREIKEANRAQCLALQVEPEQARFVATNEVSLQHAAELPGIARPLGIYVDGTMVGFTLLAFDPEEGDWLWRIMLDQAWQGQGLGNAAMKCILAYFQKAGTRRVFLHVHPDNTRAYGLYRKFGFLPNGEVDDEEEVLTLELQGGEETK